MLFLGIAYINCADNVTTTTTTATTTTASSTTTATTTTQAAMVVSTCTLNASSKTEKGFLDKVMALDKKQ